MSHVFFILICCLWGSSFHWMAVGSQVFEPMSIAAGRTMLGTVAVGTIWLTRRQAWPFARRDAVAMIFTSLIGYALPFLIQPYIIAVIDLHTGRGTAFTGMMVTMVPLATVLVSVPMLKLLPTPRQLIGVLGGLAAICVLFAGEFRGGVSAADLALAAVVPFVYALCNTYIKRRFNHLPVIALVAAMLGISTIVLGPAALLIDSVDREGPVLEAAGAMFMLGVVCTGGGAIMFYKLIQKEGPLFAGMVSYIIPTVAVIIGWLRDERIELKQIIVLAVVFIMVAIAQASPRPRVIAGAGR